MKSYSRIFVVLALLPVGLSFLFAGDGQANAQDAIPEVIATGLSTPSGVAIQPNTGHVFVADSGAGRIVRVIKGNVEAVITDFPGEGYGNGPTYNIGPLGLLFLDENTLIVGGGGLPDGEDMIRVFTVPGVGQEPIKASDTLGDAFSLKASGDKRDDDAKPGEGNFYGLARGSRGVFVTCNGDDQQGWVALATLTQGNRITKFERSIATKVATNVQAPVAATSSPQGYLTIGQMGVTRNVKDSLLTFYSEVGTKLGVYRTGLNDITGLAYGPRHKRLFALDFNWANPKLGGLYKLVDMKNDTKCEAVLMSRLEKPTALAFTTDGDCYITLAGSAKPADGKPDGKLIIIRQLDIDTTK